MRETIGAVMQRAKDRTAAFRRREGTQQIEDPVEKSYPGREFEKPTSEKRLEFQRSFIYSIGLMFKASAKTTNKTPPILSNSRASGKTSRSNVRARRTP